MLNRPKFGMKEAIGTLGGGLLNLSKGQKVDVDALLKAQMENQSQQLNGENPQYALPGNQLDQTASNLNINPNLVPGASVGAQAPSDDVVSKLMAAIGNTESSGRYGILGKPTARGDRAYGKYQVMGSNIPQWSRETLGQELTPEQFLNNPEAQDTIARARLGQYYNKTGNTDDTASMWFSGRPMRGNQSRDILGTSVPEYVARVRKMLKSKNIG